MLYFKYVTETHARIAFDDDSRRDFDILREYFKCENKAARFAKQFRYNMEPFTYVISPMGKYPNGLTAELCEKCDEIRIPYEIDDELQKNIKPSLNIDEILDVPNKTYQYRDYQKRLLEKLCDNGRGVIISPTRSGKSLVIAGLCHNIFQNVKKTNIQNILILVPNIQLVYQMHDDFEEYGLKDLYNIQMFTAKTMNKKNSKVIVDKFNVYVSNAQYLMLHGDELPYIDAIFTDEVHQIKKGSEISKLINKVKINHKFGCTGTLPKDRIDQLKISGVFGPVLDEVEIMKLQEEKILANVKVYPIKFVHSKKENFKFIPQDELEGLTKDQIAEKRLEVAQAAYKKEAIYLGMHEQANLLTLRICKNLISEHPDWNGLILFDYTSQGESLYKLFDFENKFYIDGSIDVKVRLDVVDKMNNTGGNITIAQSKTFSTGITISRINFIVLVTTQSSPTKIIQSIGRGLRRQNKTEIIVFDISHNYEYSESHFNSRVELYRKFYGLELNKDYKVKQVKI
jgi:superfamily II DNA or RNA helicase